MIRGMVATLTARGNLYCLRDRRRIGCGGRINLEQLCGELDIHAWADGDSKNPIFSCSPGIHKAWKAGGFMHIHDVNPSRETLKDLQLPLARPSKSMYIPWGQTARMVVGSLPFWRVRRKSLHTSGVGR